MRILYMQLLLSCWSANPVTSSVAHKHSTKPLEGHRIHFSAVKQCGINFQHTGVTGSLQ